MQTDICQSPACEFFSTCKLRPTPEPPAEQPEAIENLNPGRNGAGGVTFTLRLDMPAPVIGELCVTGDLTNDGVSEALDELNSESPAGLLVIFNTRGGRGTAGHLIEAAILESKKHGPVVAYVEMAFSAALLPMLACTHVFIQTNGEIGGFGALLPACDGQTPFVLASAMAPKKYNGTTRQPLVYLPDPAKIGLFQAIVDEGFSEGLKWAAQYTGRAPAELAPLLDGRILDAKEAVKAGLVAGVLAHQGMAFDLLYQLARTGRKHLF